MTQKALNNRWFLFDCGIMVLLILMLLFMHAVSSTIISEEIEAFLLLVRCSVQIVRMVFYFCK